MNSAVWPEYAVSAPVAGFSLQPCLTACSSLKAPVLSHLSALASALLPPGKICAPSSLSYLWHPSRPLPGVFPEPPGHVRDPSSLIPFPCASISPGTHPRVVIISLCVRPYLYPSLACELLIILSNLFSSPCCQDKSE